MRKCYEKLEWVFEAVCLDVQLMQEALDHEGNIVLVESSQGGPGTLDAHLNGIDAHAHVQSVHPGASGGLDVQIHIDPQDQLDEAAEVQPGGV